MTATITLLLGLLVASVVFASLATRLRVPYAILLVLAGVGLGFIPGLPKVVLDPDLILLVFLPPLVYSSAWQTSWREFRANLRSILLLAVGLVLVTTAVVAIVAHVLLGLPWAVAFVLGAVLSPTDAVAASAIAKRMGLSRRIVTVLEGESMVNDATGLVVYSFAVAAAVTGDFQFGAASVQFVVVGLGGLVVGLVIGWPVAWVHRHLDDAPIEITITLLTPFAAYLLAEVVHVSGVLATLSAGLYLSRHSSRFFSSTTRLQADAVWSVLTFLLNGLLFLLIGLQLRHIVEALGERPLASIIGESLLVSLTVIVVRLAWVFAATYLPRRFFPRVHPGEPLPQVGDVTVVAWTGLRGGISLAAALALPLTLEAGRAFPERDRLIAFTFGVILVTLVGQGLSLIPLIRWLKLAPEEEPEQERQHARLVTAQAALTRLQDLAGQEWVPEAVRMHLRARYEDKAQQASEERDGALPSQDGMRVAKQRLQHEVITAERVAVIALRDQGQIDDEVLREIERELDLEEQRV